jgi:hypothetical protein
MRVQHLEDVFGVVCKNLRAWLNMGFGLGANNVRAKRCEAEDYCKYTNDQLDAQFFFLYVYFYSLHVSSNLVLIIRRINCINRTYSMCHSDRLVCKSGRNFPTCILDGHLHTVTRSRCSIDTIDPPDDEHEFARNM